MICALSNGICQSYWTNTGSADEIISLMKKKFIVITDDIIRLIAGIPVDHLENYSAEKLSLNTRKEILSAMTVYGFLSYHDETLEIPKEELQKEFAKALLKEAEMGNF